MHPLSIALGVIAGVLGFLPLAGALPAAKRVTSTSNFSHATILIVAVVGSSAILFGAVVACIILSRDNLVSFAGGEAAGLIVTAIAFGVKQVILRKQ